MNSNSNGTAAILTAALLSTSAALSQDATVVRYKDFGAKGDGKTNDHAAIVAAHDYANEHDLPVKADDDATYYIGDITQPATIKTDVDFGKAKFIIDDSKIPVEKRNISIFTVVSDKPTYNPKIKGPLKERQANIGMTFPCKTMIIVFNANVKHFIRWGANRNDGTSASDSFIVDEQGNVDPTTPIVWDFETVTSSQAIPLDVKPITIRGGHFTTIANQAESKYTYYARNIKITRPNTTITGMTHLVTGELDHGAPYGSFLGVNNCANVVIRDSIVTGHKTYTTIGSAGTKVMMGTYDLGAGRTINLSFINLQQSNDIMDTRYWGVLGTNYCKNLLYDNCKVSRFDAHCGVCNATIRNSELGHAGVNLIGYGTFLIENSIVHGHTMLSLRSDYGSFWRGDLIIKNCTFVNRNRREVCIIGGSNSGKHNFGYECRMPTNIIIDGLTIDDNNIHFPTYNGPFVFAGFNGKYDEKYKEDYPYIRTKSVTAKNIKTASGKALRLAYNLHFFKNTTFDYEK